MDARIEEMARRLRNDVYAVTVKVFEEAEHAGLIIGNGHHIAQNLAEQSAQVLTQRASMRTGYRQIVIEGGNNAK